MFFHIFKYRLISFFREKEEFFWCLLFPIILCICFKVGFSEISNKAWTFHSIPVAVVYEENNDAFKEVLTSLSEDDSQGEPFLKLQETDLERANKLLTDEDIDGIIIVDEEISIIVGKTGLNQTALHTFVNQYLQQANMITQVSMDNPAAIEDLIASMNETVNYIKSDSFSDKKMDAMDSYYFSLIGMAALFGGYYGMRCIRQLKADSTPEGKRKTLSSAGRGKLILAEFFATYVVHIILMLVLILVLKFALRIEFGGNMGFVALCCMAGSFNGIATGMLMGSFSKLKEAAQVVIFVGYSLLSSFLSGLMVADMKMIIQHHAPIINALNPATLISDSLYSLSMYNTHERYFQNILTLFAMGIVFIIIAIIRTRRERYASV